ncbi:MAG TPA: RICIN domain-containing protein [Pseudomonadota bacterium]|jgi:hypothetical protein|nr:RICIN domain-containing protein [Pseudomonadota bacterium]
MKERSVLVSGAFIVANLLSISAAQAQHHGPFAIRAGQKCLDLNGPQVKVNGGRVQLWDCTGAANQLWRWDRGRIVSMANNRCLDLNGPDTGDNGGRIQVWDCHGGPNQHWRHERGALIVQADNRCLDVHGPDIGQNRAHVQSWDCHFGPNQQWIIEPVAPQAPPAQAPLTCESRLGPFAWSCARPIPGMICEQIREPADPHTWSDNFFCSDRPLGMKWSNSGLIPGMRCTQIVEPADPHTWNDNFLCLPHGSPYRLQWSYSGPIPGLACVAWNEPSDPHTWHDNFLCFSERQEPGPVPMPPPGPMPPPPPAPVLRDVEAGPIWNNDHAAQRCPAVCQPGRWTGSWRTTIPGRMSICSCAPY